MSQLAEDDIRQTFAKLILAMQTRDVSILRSLTGESFTLTHITGYVQPRDEWLAEIVEGKFVYHSIKVQDIRVRQTGQCVVARTLTDATVYGGRNTWKLQLVVSYVRCGDCWLAGDAVATLWT